MRASLGAKLAIAAFVNAGCEVSARPPGTASDQPTSLPAPTGTANPQAGAPALPPATSPVPPSAEAGLVGRWESVSCGERKYPRIIEFDTRGGFRADDLVSPCPPKALCVWSGIVTRQGKYSVSGRTVTLTLEGSAPAAPQGSAFPTVLDLGPGPIESAAGARCEYVPAGPKSSAAPK